MADRDEAVAADEDVVVDVDLRGAMSGSFIRKEDRRWVVVRRLWMRDGGSRHIDTAELATPMLWASLEDACG